MAFLVAWSVVIFIFFSISQSKLPGYFLPAIVPLSILTAKVWAEIEDAAPERPAWLRAGFLTMIALGIVVAVSPQAFRLQAIEVAATEKISPAVLALIKPALFYSGLILIALGILGRNLAARWAGQKLALVSLGVLALTMPLLGVRWARTLAAYANASSSRRLAQVIQQSPEKGLPFYGFFCFRPSLPFYLRHPVGLVTTDASELTSNYVASHLPRLRREAAQASAQSGTAPVFMDAADFRFRALHGTQPMLVMVRNRDVRKLSQLAPEMEPLWNDWEFSVWRIPAGKREEVGSRK
jgi:4-amino-4-deoxy-L-arabinose transferase-like glycosyltransferase